MKFFPNLTQLPLFEKVIPVIQETSISCFIISTIIFHFTDGEGLSVDFCSTKWGGGYFYIFIYTKLLPLWGVQTFEFQYFFMFF